MLRRARVAWLVLLVWGLASGAWAADTDGSVAVTVVNPDGKAVLDARVTLVELRRSTFVDDEGKVEFERVPAGDYHLEVTSQRFGSAVSEFAILEGQRYETRVELGRSVHRERIVVTATPGGRGSAETVVPIAALDSEELSERLKPTLGETLAQEPGIHSTFFGAGASRPVIRGQSGGRVRILEDGLGVGDASTTSPDHAVGTDPISAESIEVVRGPAALLYDTSAIGGLVNVLDARIPDHAPKKPIGGSLDLRFGSAADERSGALDLNGGGERFAWHLDGARRETHDYEIPTPAVAGDASSPSDSLPNSAMESTTLTLGGSAILDNGFVGVAARRFETQYGIQEVELEPVGVGGGAEEEGGVVIDLEQMRYDLRGGLRFDQGFVEQVSFGVGVTDYEHVEIEGGEQGTLFFNDSVEARVQLGHGENTPLPGALGLQYRNGDARAEGEEAFVPESETETLAVFALQEIERGPFRIGLGGRFETTDVGVGTILPEIADRIATNPNCSDPRDVDFTSFSASAGVVWLHDKGYAVSGSLSRAVRSPGGEELFSCGPHLATQSFEVGNGGLGKETGLALDVTLRKRAGRVKGEVNLFRHRFDDYIFEAFSGRILTEEGEEFDPVLTPDPEFVLPEYLFRQADAEFYGAELRTLIDLFSDEQHHLDLELMGDFVRAELRRTGEHLPRIPPARFGIGLHYRGAQWYGAASIRRVAEQDRLAPSETIESPLVEGLELIGGRTDAYTMVNASAGYRTVRGGLLHDVMLRASNLTDEEARVHTSRLKNVAPLPGLDLTLSYRLVF